MNAILVTGATGFIGRRLVGELAARGEAVVVLHRPGTPDAAEFPRGITTASGDILDPDSLNRAMAGCDRVYHLAGYAKNWSRDPGAYVRVNVGGLANVLAAARRNGVHRVVWTSSAVTPGPSNGSPVDEAHERTVGPFTEYERSKVLAEEEAARFPRGGPGVVTVLPSRVFGPGLLNEGNSVTKMIALYLSGMFRFIPGNGSAVGNYAYVEDVVSGTILAMERGVPGERYILGGENVSYDQFFRTVARVSGVSRHMFHLHPALAYGFAAEEEFRSRFGHHPVITPGWVRTFLADWAVTPAKAARELGYAPTPFREAVEETVRWLRSGNGGER